jgi:predicted nucleic acid-binding protein
MALLLDTNLWIGLTRAKSPRSLKSLIAPYVLDRAACLAEPIAFEVLRGATDAEARKLAAYFDTMTVLRTPTDLWARGVDLGRACRSAGVTPGSVDLLIAAIAIEHGAELVTFDDGFRLIARVSALKVRLLQRPSP